MDIAGAVATRSQGKGVVTETPRCQHSICDPIDSRTDVPSQPNPSGLKTESRTWFCKRDPKGAALGSISRNSCPDHCLEITDIITCLCQ